MHLCRFGHLWNVAIAETLAIRVRLPVAFRMQDDGDIEDATERPGVYDLFAENEGSLAHNSPAPRLMSLHAVYLLRHSFHDRLQKWGFLC